MCAQKTVVVVVVVLQKFPILMPVTLALGGKCQRYFIFGSKLKNLHLKAFLSGTLELGSESKVEKTEKKRDNAV